MSRHSDTERDAQLLAQLDEPTARALFPERFDDPIAVTLVYPALHGDAAAAAAALEAAAERLERTASADGTDAAEVVRATFRLENIEALHDLYVLVETHADDTGVEVLIDGTRVPMVRELWLPLLWNLRS